MVAESRGEDYCLQRGTKKLCRVIMFGITEWFAFVKNHQTLHLHGFILFLYKLYPNIFDFKNIHDLSP